MNSISTTHIIESVEPKKGTRYNPYHDQVVNRKCVIHSLQIGEHGVIGIEFDDDIGYMHNFFTTTIQSICEKDDCVTFETKNTFYKLRKI